MTQHDDGIRDPELSALFRRLPSGAPESWMSDALLIPQRGALHHATANEPWLVVLAPHFAALFLIGGMAMTLFVPSIRGAIAGVIPELHRQDPDFWTVAGLLTPLLLLLCHQGARGFPAIRRYRH